MITIPSNIDPKWGAAIKKAQSNTNWTALEAFLNDEYHLGKEIYPPKNLIFNAFSQTPLDKIKVVILGQDPYHGARQAMGLSFSVPDGVRHPPSLRNIFKEIHRDLGHPIPKSGNLTSWAQQGVFLLNTVLTVEELKAGSHQNKGWETFTDSIIQTISEQGNNIVFMLWGTHAQKKKSLIDCEKHLVLESVHPSPLSAHRGFIGCGHFGKANDYLRVKVSSEIDWCLPTEI